MTSIINPDGGREKRCGIPEVVFGLGKSSEDLSKITKRFIADYGRIIITKIDDEKADFVVNLIKNKNLDILHNKKGRILVIKKKGLKIKKNGRIGILTAGTSDIYVAEEARTVAEELGCNVTCAYDVGIAGIQRVFTALQKMKNCQVLIVIAGMEGALPSIISGLVPVPVIGVPTSVGYGTGKGGMVALFTMLNSCSPVAVVNIDNGYGAAVLAYKITKKQILLFSKEKAFGVTAIGCNCLKTGKIGSCHSHSKNKGTK